MPRDLQYLREGYHRHPDNPYGQGSPEFWEEEARLYDFPTAQALAQYKKSIAPKCPICGTPRGFSFGTGDCGCEPRVDVGF